ncbi:MAG TPA: hypothetical protein VK506_02215 [Conexibacter sp.]|nr:hypothetical protein [Conexibacter sp.]
MLRGRGRTGRHGATAVVLAVLVALLAFAPVAAHAKLPTYRSPGYRGTTKVPRLRAQAVPPAKPVELSAAGRFPDTYVDAAGTAHAVWTEDDGDNRSRPAPPSRSEPARRRSASRLTATAGFRRSCSSRPTASASRPCCCSRRCRPTR